MRGSRLTITRAGTSEEREEPLLAYLARELARLHTASPELPFDLDGGFVGRFGYELKADCGATEAHDAPLHDALLLLADRIVAIDHERGEAHLVALSPAGSERSAARWIEHAAAALTDLPPLAATPRSTVSSLPPRCNSRAGASTTWRTSRPASACSKPARATRSA